MTPRERFWIIVHRTFVPNADVAERINEALDAAVAAAVLEERETCAETVIDSLAWRCEPRVAAHAANAIRARPIKSA